MVRIACFFLVMSAAWLTPALSRAQEVGLIAGRRRGLSRFAWSYAEASQPGTQALDAAVRAAG